MNRSIRFYDARHFPVCRDLFRLRIEDDAPQTFDQLITWFKSNRDKHFTDFVAGTKGKFFRRLKYIVHEGDGVLRRNDTEGSPLDLPKAGIAGPIVIDLFGIRLTPSLQRFVVAAVFHQLVLNRSGKTTEGLRYLVTLDELNRFAPKNNTDPITEQIEQVAAEMRSQGVILLGAQQQASLVSPRVIENSGIRAIGRSGTLELSSEVWKVLDPAARSQAAQMQADEKLILQPSFRAPMLAKIPYPPWALKKEDVDISLAQGSSSTGSKISRREADFA